MNLGDKVTMHSKQNTEGEIITRNNQKNDGSTLKEFPPPYMRQGFKNLTHLDISGNQAEKIDLRSLDRLEWLCCANNNLEVLLLSGTSLTYLDCSHNNLLSISVDPVPNNLTTLLLSYNNLESLPNWIWMVPELFSVQASHNRIRKLDCRFKNCLSSLPLRELHLQCNQIEFVSKDFIQRATRLRILNLSRNLIEHMPNFGKRCSVQELYMSRNNLEDSEDTDALDFLYDCVQLKRLYLAFNKIERINERCVSNWKNLEELILCGNRIKSLPSKISSLSHLRVLRVHSNLVENVPSLTKMQALKMVDLSHNNLKKINLENLISGGNLTYLDISCNERLNLNTEKLTTQNRRPMNLVEVSNPRKIQSARESESRDFPANPPWDIGFAELPDKNLVLSVSQYRDVNISNGREALFGLFDGGEGNASPKYISRSIAKIYNEEKNIEETHGFSLKYTLLNAMKSIRQQGHSRPLQGILCLLSTQEDALQPSKSSCYLNLAMLGNIRCLLLETGKKITRLTDVTETGLDRAVADKRLEDSELPSYDNNTSETNSAKSEGSSTENNLSGNIPDPKVLSVPISTSAEFLVIGNQSTWNYINEEELIEELEAHRHEKSVLIAKRLADMAQCNMCKHSISLIVVKFRWNFPKAFVRSTNMRARKNIRGGDLGPLSYCSGSSECSESASNPLTSVVTPDSAIDTDRFSGAGSVGSNGGSTKSASSNVSENPAIVRPTYTLTEGKESSKVMGTLNDRRSQRDDDETSIGGTSVDQMSVEQFKCWEYMLQENTTRLFKKELDTLSKGVFQRNNKQRKSVHFPYQQQQGNSNIVHPSTVQKSKTPVINLSLSTAQGRKGSSNSTISPGFYTLSEAKSLSHLFGGEPSSSKVIVPTDQPLTQNTSGRRAKSIFGIGNMNASSLLGSVRSNAKRSIIGGPNAAYFSSSQRQANIPPQIPLSELHEIQEVKNFDSIEYDSRLKRYWENKITEL